MKIKTLGMYVSLTFRTKSKSPFLSHSPSNDLKKVKVIDVKPNLKILPIQLEIYYSLQVNPISLYVKNLSIYSRLYLDSTFKNTF